MNYCENIKANKTENSRQKQTKTAREVKEFRLRRGINSQIYGIIIRTSEIWVKLNNGYELDCL